MSNCSEYLCFLSASPIQIFVCQTVFFRYNDDFFRISQYFFRNGLTTTAPSIGQISIFVSQSRGFSIGLAGCVMWLKIEAGWGISKIALDGMRDEITKARSGLKTGYRIRWPHTGLWLIHRTLKLHEGTTLLLYIYDFNYTWNKFLTSIIHGLIIDPHITTSSQLAG